MTCVLASSNSSWCPLVPQPEAVRRILPVQRHTLPSRHLLPREHQYHGERRGGGRRHLHHHLPQVRYSLRGARARGAGERGAYVAQRLGIGSGVTLAFALESPLTPRPPASFLKIPVLPRISSHVSRARSLTSLAKIASLSIPLTNHVLFFMNQLPAAVLYLCVDLVSGFPARP